MSDDKEKLSIYVDSETARAIRMESARLGIAQGDLIAQAWSEYKDRGHAEDQSEDQAQTQTQAVEIKVINPEELKRRKKDQTERETREMRIAKAREILDDWQAFDIDMIKLYERRMNELGEKNLAKELKELVDYKRRVL